MQPSQLISRDKIDAAYDELYHDSEFAYTRAKVLADMLGIPVYESPKVTGTILGLVRGKLETLIKETAGLKAPLTTLCERTRQLGILTEALESIAYCQANENTCLHPEDANCELCYEEKARQALKDAGMEDFKDGTI